MATAKTTRTRAVPQPITAAPTDIAWAAGFFDGEGTVGVTRGYFIQKRWGPYHHMKIVVTQRVRLPLDRLVAIFGGSVCRSKTRNLFIWTCTTRYAAAALDAMLPYLTVKRDQALIAVAFQSRRKLGGHARADGSRDEADMAELARLKRVE